MKMYQPPAWGGAGQRGVDDVEAGVDVGVDDRAPLRRREVGDARLLDRRSGGEQYDESMKKNIAKIENSWTRLVLQNEFPTLNDDDPPEM